MNQRVIVSPIGKLLLMERDGFLTQVRLIQPEEEVCAQDAENSVLDAAQIQLAEYFAGERRLFDLPIDMLGTAFEQEVWRALLDIGYGTVESYGALAARLGRPAAARAVGGACSRNPLLIVVPCHRVIASSGRLTGFAAGMEAKRMLLALEGQKIRADRIIIE